MGEFQTGNQNKLEWKAGGNSENPKPWTGGFKYFIILSWGLHRPVYVFNVFHQTINAMHEIPYADYY